MLTCGVLLLGETKHEVGFPSPIRCDYFDYLLHGFANHFRVLVTETKQIKVNGNGLKPIGHLSQL